MQQQSSAIWRTWAGLGRAVGSHCGIPQRYRTTRQSGPSFDSLSSIQMVERCKPLQFNYVHVFTWFKHTRHKLISFPRVNSVRTGLGPLAGRGRTELWKSATTCMFVKIQIWQRGGPTEESEAAHGTTWVRANGNLQRAMYTTVYELTTSLYTETALSTLISPYLVCRARCRPRSNAYAYYCVLISLSCYACTAVF